MGHHGLRAREFLRFQTITCAILILAIIASQERSEVNATPARHILGAAAKGVQALSKELAKEVGTRAGKEALKGLLSSEEKNEKGLHTLQRNGMGSRSSNRRRSRRHTKGLAKAASALFGPDGISDALKMHGESGSDLVTLVKKRGIKAKSQ